MTFEPNVTREVIRYEKKIAPQNCPKKLLIIALDQEFLVQQVFGFV